MGDRRGPSTRGAELALPSLPTSQAAKWPRRTVILALSAYALVFAAYALLRYYSFRTLYFDLGIFSQSMSHVLHGSEGIETLLLPSAPGHIGHFSPILVLPLAVYALLPSPATLLVFQSLLLALAALPLFDLALEVLHRTDLAVAISVAYLLYPALQGVNRYDFHVEAFVPLLAFCALLALVRQRYGSFLVASLLLLCTHEYLSVVYLWTGLVLVVYQVAAKKDALVGLVSRRWSVTTFALGAAFLGLEELLNVVLTPSHASVFAWLSTTTSTFSGGPSSILGGILVDPGWKLLYWVLLLAPLVLLPLQEGRLALPAIPWLGLTVLASNPAIYSIYSQYPALVLPFLFFAAVWALRRPRPIPRVNLSGRRLAITLVAAGLIASATMGPLSPLNLYDGIPSSQAQPPYPPLVTAHDQATARLLGLIPRNASVLAQNELFPQVSDRDEVAPYWNASQGGPPGYIALDTARVWFDRVLPPFPGPLRSLAASLLANDSYTVAGFSGTAFVYRLGNSTTPSLVTPAVVQPTASEFASSWTTSDALAKVDAGGLHLRPGTAPMGVAWTSMASPGDLWASAELTWTNVTGAGAWSGVVLGEPGTDTFQVVFLAPGSGTMGYLRFVQGVEGVASLGNFTPTGNSVRLDVLESGGILQVWTDGRFAGFFAGEPSTNTTALGFAASGQDLTVTGLRSYRSTADVAPPGGDIPWDGIVAVAAIVVPVIAFLLLVPRPGAFFDALLRRRQER